MAARRDLLACLILVILIGAAYASVAGHGFVTYDDETYVVKNPMVNGGLSGAGSSWAFGLHGYAANWHPLTWITHMLDVSMFGLRAGAHHLVNVVLHAASAILLFVFLRRTTRSFGAALFVAALFAVHPLRVESVAWIAERKDVLSGLFFMATLVAYARWTQARSSGNWWLVTLFFVAGLLSKPMLVTLPFVLLLVDQWPLRRRDENGTPAAWSTLIGEKVIWFVLSFASAGLTYFAQARGGALLSSESLELTTRLANAAVVSWVYLWKSLWPADLACFYPHPALLDPGASLLVPGVIAALALVVVSVVAWRARCTRAWLFSGWFWYLGMLVPVVGIVQVGGQQLADRYAYLPLIGFHILLACAVVELCGERAVRVRWGLGSAVVLALALRTGFQVPVWRDSETLFRHAVAVTERNYVAHANLGLLAARAGRRAEALDEYRAVLEVRPEHAEALNNLGGILMQEGRNAEARPYIERALRVFPGYVEAWYNLGLVCVALKDENAARQAFRNVQRLRPDFEPAREQLRALDN